MQHLISILFIIEILLIIFIMSYNLFKEGVNFKVGISFALLFFIFIPIGIMIAVGNIELSKSDFSYTTISDVVLKENIGGSVLLLLYIFSIIIYLYFPSLRSPTNIKYTFKPSLKVYFVIYMIASTTILIGSGLLQGGNWYQSRHQFFESTGSIAVLIAFVLNSSKILIMSTLVYYWITNYLSFFKFLIFVVGFAVLDMIFSGNRIYLFCIAIIIGLVFLKRNPKKTIILFPVLLPIIFILGYFASIFRHIRGPLFAKGIPSFTVFVDATKRAMMLEPPDPRMFLLGISESVNVNVIYDVFNRFNDYLYGATYLKPFFFYVPRSLWSGKPKSITTIAADNFGGTSLVTTIIGEMHMNFSIFGILILPFLLFFTEAFIKKSLNKYGSISNIIAFFFAILFFRMPFSDEFLVFLFLLIILVLFNYFKKYKFILKKRDE